MNTTANFIADRAQSLAYEACRFPATSQAALAWLRLAHARAERQELSGLAEEIASCLASILAARPQHKGVARMIPFTAYRLEDPSRA